MVYNVQAAQETFNIQVILLAAGQSKRFDGVKQLAKIRRGHDDGVSCSGSLQSNYLLEHSIQQLLLSDIKRVHVVLGANEKLIKESICSELLLKESIVTLKNENWARGMGDSIRYAVAQILSSPFEPTHLLITLGDLPALTSAHFQQLIDACRRKPQSIIASAYNDSIGVPCIIPRALFAELETLSGDIGAKKVLKRHIQNVYQVPLPEAGFDIDTQDDLQRFNR